MITKKSIATDKVINGIDKTLKELKNGLKRSELTDEDISELQNDLNQARKLALSLKKKFQ